MINLMPEHLTLIAALVWGLVQLMMATTAATHHRGLAWNLGARDSSGSALPPKAARLSRAFANFMETFPFFVTAMLVVLVTQRMGTWSTIGGWTYLAARVIYVPLYVFAINGVRTLVWCVSLIGILMILASALGLA